MAHDECEGASQKCRIGIRKERKREGRMTIADLREEDERGREFWHTSVWE